MKFNRNQSATLMGSKAPKSVIHKSESHKLHQAFPVKDGDTIVQGMPVMINADGTISPYVGTGLFIGVATTNSEYPAYEDKGEIEVTVAVNGYAIICGKASAALNAGAVLPTALGKDEMYVTYKTDTNDAPRFISLQKASGAGELIHVLVR